MEYRTEEQKRADYEDAAARARAMERDQRNVEVFAQACVWLLVVGVVWGAWWLVGGVR